MVLEWSTRSGYVLTELTFFLIVCFILLITAAAFVVIVVLHHKGRHTLFPVLRIVFQNVFTSDIAFTRQRKEEKIVFLGQEQQCDYKHSRLLINLYLTLLCCVFALWFVTVFSDAVLYRKAGTCFDLNVHDSDTRCFLLPSSSPPPREIQNIIDKEEGEAVPCQCVQNYLITTNTTYNLEVICYTSRISPLPALGVAYGTTKTIIFIVTIILTLLFSISSKIQKKYSIIQKSKVHTFIIQTVLIVTSLVFVILIVAVIASLHGAESTRNGGFDYLRGEQFYQGSVIFLASITAIVTVGIFPWRAFTLLEAKVSKKNPKENDSVNALENDDFTGKIQHMILLHQFSIEYIS